MSVLASSGTSPRKGKANTMLTSRSIVALSSWTTFCLWGNFSKMTEEFHSLLLCLNWVTCPFYITGKGNSIAGLDQWFSKCAPGTLTPIRWVYEVKTMFIILLSFFFSPFILILLQVYRKYKRFIDMKLLPFQSFFYFCFFFFKLRYSWCTICFRCTT